MSTAVFYKPGKAPDAREPEAKELGLFMERELGRVATSFAELPLVRVQELFVEADRPRDGMLVYADGTHWDPGDGEGFYGRVAGSWAKLEAGLGPAGPAGPPGEGDASVNDSGAVGDGIYVTGATSITTGTDDLTVTGASFALADVGKRIVVPGAGSAGVPLSTTIAAWVSATQVQLGANASTTLSAVSTRVLYGTDDGAAIQAAIDSLPATGGTVVAGPGIYLTTVPLTIGNGNSTTASTRYGVRFLGKSTPIFSSPDALYPRDPGTALAWAGTHGTGNSLLSVLGPLRGFEIANFYLDGMELAGQGISLYAASFGGLDNLSWAGFIGAGLYTTAYSTSTFAGDVNTSHITGDKLYFRPTLAGSTAIYFDGASDGSADTHSCVFNVVRVYHPPGSVLTYGIVFRICDTITINNMLQISNPRNDTCECVVYDYTGHGSFPSCIVINEVDVAFGATSPMPEANQFKSYGTPTSGLPIRFNIINHLGETNGGRTPKVLANTLVGLPMKQCVDVDQIGLTAAIGATNWFQIDKVSMWRISYYIEITTAGTAGTIGFQLGWNSPGNTGNGFTAATLNATVDGDHTQGTFPIMVVASSIPQIVVAFAGVTGSPVYNLFLRAEKLD